MKKKFGAKVDAVAYSKFKLLAFKRGIAIDCLLNDLITSYVKNNEVEISKSLAKNLS
jgi:hypothetical protein